MKFRFTAALVGLLAAISMIAPSIGTTSAQASSVYNKLNKVQKRILSGFASTELTRADASSVRARHFARVPSVSSSSSSYFPQGPNGGCQAHLGSNVNANQHCLNL